MDHLGSTRSVSNAAGTILARHTYLPFGQEITDPAQSGAALKFTGHERDEGANAVSRADDLDYMHARYCSPTVGRFLGIDPVLGSAEVPQSWNRYGYAIGNPQRYVDPTGREIECIPFTDEDGSEQQVCAEVIKVEETDPGTTPWELGWEWLTGTGLRDRTFRDGDLMTEMLRKHEHVETVVQGACSGAIVPRGSAPYELKGLQGIPKYMRDAATLTTGGLAGNLATTYLGSYGLDYVLAGGVVDLTISNSSTAASGLRPPVLGYTQVWNDHVGDALNAFFATGPMSRTTQTFNLSVPCP